MSIAIFKKVKAKQKSCTTMEVAVSPNLTMKTGDVKREVNIYSAFQRELYYKVTKWPNCEEAAPTYSKMPTKTCRRNRRISKSTF